jgi:hypothetical protein
VAQFLRPLQLHLRFHLLDLALIDEPQIEAMRVSAVTGLTLRFLQFLRTCTPEAAAAYIWRWQLLIVRLLDHPRGKDVLFALFSWYMAGAPASHETLRTVMTRIHEENPPMRSCLDLLLEMGEARGIRAMVEGQLRARFGDLPSDVRERLAAADADAMQQWGLRVLTATRIDEVFADS